MAKILNVKVEGEDKPRRIPATDVKEESGWLRAFDGGTLVGAFPLDKLEYWSFEDASAAGA